jgi:tRNA threonylcarbamoyladenosine biosynthesis protein TsaB
MSYILNIDSSTETASVSIAKDGIIILSLSNSNQKEHASFLHAAIEKLTIESGISLVSTDAIAVTIGPGSYTGLRVGLAAAKGLSYALKKPLITLSTLEAMAQQAIMMQDFPEKYIYCPMIDARRMEVFTALYNADMQELMPASALVIDEHSFGFALSEKPVLFFGSGMQKWKNITQHKHAFFEELSDISSAISSLSLEKFLQQSFADIALSAPLYVKEFFDGRQ